MIVSTAKALHDQNMGLSRRDVNSMRFCSASCKNGKSVGSDAAMDFENLMSKAGSISRVSR